MVRGETSHLRSDYKLAHELNSSVLNQFLLPSDVRGLCRISERGQSQKCQQFRHYIRYVDTSLVSIEP